MRKKNVIPCFNKREKLSDKNSCCNCTLYKNNECDGDLEINLYRQDNNGGYELYQPLQELINKIARCLPVINTKKVLEILTENYDLKIDRTLIFKYHKKGLLEKEQKICKGRAGGVKTYWNDNTPGKVFVIKELLKQNFKLAEISKYREMIYKEPLKNFQAIINNPAKSLEIAKLYAVAAFFAAAEAGIDFRQYSFSKNLHYELNLNVDSLTIKLRDIIVLTKLKEGENLEWKPIKTVIYKNNQVIVS